VKANVVDNPECRELTGLFADRQQAGVLLAELLAGLNLDAPLLLAIPAGGVPVAAGVADQLGWSLDVAVVSKIVLPWNSEVGYGAVAFDGSYLLNEELIRVAALDEPTVQAGIAATRAKVAHRVTLLRGGAPLPDPAGRTAVLVDDGLASGFTLLTAVRALRRAGATHLVVAVPTAHRDAIRRLASEVETICCVNIRSGYQFAVAAAYRQWSAVDEAQAQALLQSAATRRT